MPGDAEHDGADVPDTHLNASLRDVAALMAQELERLQLELETLRLLKQRASDARIRDLVARIDLRQDRLAEVMQLIAAQDDDVH